MNRYPPLPQEIAECSQLSNLSLRNNKLSGPLPTDLGRCTLLENIILEGNQLSGPLPASLARCKKIIWLYVHDNMLAGPIPPLHAHPLILGYRFQGNSGLTISEEEKARLVAAVPNPEAEFIWP